MPKKSQTPKLRSHSWVKRGVKLTAYYYDMRGTGEPDIPLGTDKEDALRRWRAITDGSPIVRYSRPRKVPAPVVKKLAPRLRGKRRDFARGSWDGLPWWAQSMYLGAEKRAKDKGMLNFIGLDEFRAVIDRCAGKCEVSGIELDQTRGGGRKAFGPSIDRIDSSKGYVAGNVRIVALMVNQALGEWGENELMVMVNAVTRKNTSAKSPLVLEAVQAAAEQRS